jgi:hypothetical protein
MILLTVLYVWFSINPQTKLPILRYVPTEVQCKQERDAAKGLGQCLPTDVPDAPAEGMTVISR